MDIIPPSKPGDKSGRSELSRFRAAIKEQRHWVIATDDSFVAASLALLYHLITHVSKAPDTVFVERTVLLPDRCDSIPLTVLALPKAVILPQDAAVTVAGFTGQSCGQTLEAIRAGADMFTASRDPSRIALVLELVRRGAVSDQPPGNN